MSNVSRIEQRKIEAAILASIYAQLKEELGQQRALAIIKDTVEKDSFEAGQAFAASAPSGLSLEHFLTITEAWADSGALEIGEVELSGNSALFSITRCAYVETYRDMGLPEELIPLLSCVRDEPFAKGYSERLSMVRSETIAAGFPACRFTFIWK